MFRCNCTSSGCCTSFSFPFTTCCFPWEWWWISRNRLQGLLTWVQVQVWTPFDAYLISCQILCCFIAMSYLVCFIMSQSSVSACLTEAVSVETWCLERGGTCFFSAKSPWRMWGPLISTHRWKPTEPTIRERQEMERRFLVILASCWVWSLEPGDSRRNFQLWLSFFVGFLASEGWTCCSSNL